LPDYGKAFEHWVLMELCNCRLCRSSELPISFGRTSTGLEVDFVVAEMSLAIEAKSRARVRDGGLRGRKALAESQR
jgi:hypothetical protein